MIRYVCHDVGHAIGDAWLKARSSFKFCQRNDFKKQSTKNMHILMVIDFIYIHFFEASQSSKKLNIVFIQTSFHVENRRRGDDRFTGSDNLKLLAFSL